MDPNDPNQFNQPNPQVPQSPEYAPATSRLPRTMIIVVIIMVLLLLGTIGLYLSLRNRNQTPAETTPEGDFPLPTAVQVPSTDLLKGLLPTGTIDASTSSALEAPSSSWKTYTGSLFSFRYPPTLTFVERQKNYVVLLPDPENTIGVFMTIDARLGGTHANYSQAVTKTKASLQNPEMQQTDNGTRISGTLSPGFGQGEAVTVIFLKYKQAAIAIETTTDVPGNLQLFNQITSTIRVTSSE